MRQPRFRKVLREAAKVARSVYPKLASEVYFKGCDIVVTHWFIDQGATKQIANGGYVGWNRRQLDLLLGGKPASRGWRKSVVGKPISWDAAAEFVMLKGLKGNSGRVVRSRS